MVGSTPVFIILVSVIYKRIMQVGHHQFPATESDL